MRSCNIFSRSLRGSPLATVLFFARAEEAFADVLRDVPRPAAAFTAAPRPEVDLLTLREDAALFEGAFLDALFEAVAFDAVAFDAVAFDAVAFDAVAFDAAPFEAVLFFDAGAFEPALLEAAALEAVTLDAAALDAALFDAVAFDDVALDAAPFDAVVFDAVAFDAAPLDATLLAAAREPAPAVRDEDALPPRAGAAALDAPLEEDDAAPALRLLPLEGAADFLLAVDLDAVPPRPFEVAIV